jgi:D-alanine-D-alanine ligase-like ATP-grasp enzyme
MRSPWSYKPTIELLYLIALGKAYGRRRNPQRQKSGKHLDAFYERVWREAALHVGAEYRPLGHNIADITRGDARVRTTENTCSIDDPVTLAIALNKLLTYRLLAESGLPTPSHTGFTLTTIDRAVAFLEATRKECVVKPAGGTGGGRGVTTGLRCTSQVARAAAAAAVYSEALIIEEQVDGDNYRLLYLDGVLLDAFVRKHPSVVGDGRSSIAALVRQANAERLSHGSGLSQVLLTIDFDMRRTLARQGLSLRSVPAAGRAVTLKTVVNENLGADNTTATDTLCPSIVAAGARAAASLHVRLAGIDIITTDPGRPLEASGGVVIEVNTTPNFYYHYHKKDGRFPVAIHVLEHLLDASSSPARAPECDAIAYASDTASR